jgi:putative membrane protein
MITIMMRWIIHALSLYIVAHILPGFYIQNFWVALKASLAIALLHMFVKPVLIILTLPITLITFGLFVFVINTVILLLASFFIRGFVIDGFWTACFGGFVISIVSSIMYSFVKK